MAANNPPPAAVFGSPAIDQAVCGIGAGVVSTLCMHPLDLLKVRFQIAGSPTALNVVPLGIFGSLRQIAQANGITSLWRGLGVNVIGNCSSWGLYFLWYSVFKRGFTRDNPEIRLSTTQNLFASGSAGVISTIMTNPIWVVRTRVFASANMPASQSPYRGFFHGFFKVFRNEGLQGLYRGATLALVGVTNGVIQVVTYERFKRWAKERKQAHQLSEVEANAIDLSNTEYILMSGSAKFVAIGLTYPYQVIRSRIQNQETTALLVKNNSYSQTLPSNARPYASIPDCISRTFRHEGIRAFYKGLWPNAVRVLPGTCLTFLVYENINSWLRSLAEGS